jgi:dephospho-CoA kinase
MVVHPLVDEDRTAFLTSTDADIVVLDIPLLFENELEGLVDLVVVVSAPKAVQRERVLARPGMTLAMLETILARQLPDVEKRERADRVIETLTLEGARAAVQALVQEIRLGQVRDA